MPQRSFGPEPVRFMVLAGLGLVVALGLASCSMPKLPSLGGAAGAASGDGLRRS